MRRAYLALAAASAVAACTPTEGDMGGQAPLAAATGVGEEVDCINVNEIREARASDSRTIDFRLKSGRVYRNMLENSCPGVQHHAFTYRTTASRLCSIDTITVMSSGPGVPGPTCGLGTFQRVEAEAR